MTTAPRHSGRTPDQLRVVTLETASRFSANWINERFGDRLELAWRQHLPAVRSVTVRGASAATDRTSDSSAGSKPASSVSSTKKPFYQSAACPNPCF